MIRPSRNRDHKILGEAILSQEVTVVLLLTSAFLETLLLLGDVANPLCSTTSHLLRNIQITVFAVLSVYAFMCLLDRMWSTWQELWRTQEDPPDHLCHSGILKAHYQRTVSLTEWIKTWAAVLERHFRAHCAFQRIHERNTLYFLYAKNGSVSFASPVFTHAGLFLVLFSIFLSLVVPESLGNLFLPLSMGGLTLSLVGLVVHLFRPYQKLWIQFAELQGRCYTTVIFSRGMGFSESEKWARRLQDALEEALTKLVGMVT